MGDFYTTEKNYRITTLGQVVTFDIPQTEDSVYSLDLLLRRGELAFAYHSYKVIQINTVGSTSLASIGDKIHQETGTEATMSVAISTTAAGKVVTITTGGVADGYLTLLYKRILNTI